MSSPRTTLYYVACGGFGAALFALNFIVGATLTYVVGLPGLSGVVTGLTTGFLLGLARLTMPRFGTVTIVFTVYCILAIPTVLMGPPGPYKVAVGVCAGVAFDALAQLFVARRIGLYLGWTAYTAVLLILTYAFFVYLELPALDKFRKAVYVLFIIFTVEGVIGILLATWTYFNHLVKLPVIRELRAADADEV